MAFKKVGVASLTALVAVAAFIVFSPKNESSEHNASTPPERAGTIKQDEEAAEALKHARQEIANAMQDPSKVRLMECIGVNPWKVKPAGWTPPTKEECAALEEKLGAAADARKAAAAPGSPPENSAQQANAGTEATPPETKSYDPIPEGWNIKIGLPGTLSVGAEYCTESGKCQFVADDMSPALMQSCQEVPDAEPCLKARIPIEVLASTRFGSAIVRLKGRNYGVGGTIWQWGKREPDGSIIGGPVSVIYQGVSIPLQCLSSTKEGFALNSVCGPSE